MFHDNSGNPREDLLFYVIQRLAEGNQMLAAVVAGAQEKDARSRRPRREQPQTRRHQPQEKEYREWATFRAAFVDLERAARRMFNVPPGDVVSPEQVHMAGGPSPKTQQRIMELTHGLRGDQWPPSTWPVDPPEPPN